MSDTLDIKPKTLLSVTAMEHEIPTYEQVEKMGLRMASNAVANELISLLGSREGKYISMAEYRKIVDLITHKNFDMHAAFHVYLEFQRLGRHSDEYPLLKYEELMKKMKPWVEKYNKT